jgi:hypothetical protein
MTFLSKMWACHAVVSFDYRRLGNATEFRSKCLFTHRRNQTTPSRVKIQSTRPTDLHKRDIVQEIKSRRMRWLWHLDGPQKLIRYSDSLRAGRSGLGGGEIFRTRPDQPWGPPSFLCNGYRVSFPWVERPGRGVDHPPSSSPRLKKEQSYTSNPSRSSWLV